MKHCIGLFGLTLLGLVACQRQEPALTPLSPPPPAEPLVVAPPPAKAEPTVPAPPPAPPAATAEERSKWFKDCWTAFNAKDYPKFSACYAENATSEQVDSGMAPLAGRANIVDKSAKVFAAAFPDIAGEHQLTLVSGNDILSVVLLKGTHKGSLPGPQGEIPPTNKKIGYLLMHHAQTSPDGRSLVKDRFLYDTGTFLSQLGVSKMPARKALDQGWVEKPSLVSSGSDAEKSNLAAFNAWVAATNKYDPAAIGAASTDDIVLSDLAAPADRVGKKELQKAHEELFKAFPDLKLEQSRTWAGGDYVIAAGRLTGTNTGDAPAMKLRKTGKAVNIECYTVAKLAGGKVKQAWIFSNGMAFASQLGMLPPPPKASKPGPAPAAAGKEAKPAAMAAAPMPAPAKDAKAAPPTGAPATPPPTAPTPGKAPSK